MHFHIQQVVTLFLGILITTLQWQNAHAQDTNWTAKDKQSLIDNYLRTKNEINKETSGLTVKQWNFKEAPGSWSIAEVMEHLNMWQLITQEHIRYMFYNGPQPQLALKAQTDSAATTFIYEERKHIAPDYSVPTNTIPDKANLALFNSYCDRIVENIRNSDLNFRMYYRTFTDGYMTNMNQAYIIHYGHVDRHLRQIRRIKKDAKFPK